MNSHWEVVVIAAALLSLERLTYVWIWRAPRQVESWCARLPVGVSLNPVSAVRAMFTAFKVLQAGVFAAWCYAFGGGVIWPSFNHAGAAACGVVLVGTGQLLNLAVFRRLGEVGVFYGSRFGHAVPYVTGFPFSLFTHPQYVGTVLSIWGVFLLMRFPHADWFLLPAIETVYYAAGARLERFDPRMSGDVRC